MPDNNQKPPLDEILKIEDEVLLVLGVDRAALADMNLRQLIELAHDKGYDIDVNNQPAPPGAIGKACVVMGPEQVPALEAEA